MSTKINLTYCGMDGSGATVKLAKQDAARKIEAVLNGYYTPTMIRAGNLVGFMWREPNGYCYKIVRPETESGSLFGSSIGDASESDTRRALARHMAQNLGTYAELTRELDSNDIRELDGYFAFQRKYAEARASGMTDTQAYDFANQR